MTFTIAPPQPFLATSQDFYLDPPALPTELTVAQAARVLDVPEGAVLELFTLGILECRQEGMRRLTNRDRLLIYKQERDRGCMILAEMVRLDQEMGLYDE